MTWTYSGDPGASDKDEIRFLVGDTNADAPLVQDEEIAYILTIHAGDDSINYQAAADVAEAIAAQFARKAQRSIGPLAISAEQQYEHYVDVAKRLRGLAATGGRSGALGLPVLGGGGGTYLMGTWK